MMPSRAGLLSSTTRSSRLARAKAATAAIFGPCSRASCSSGGSGQRMFSPPGGISKSVGSDDLDARRDRLSIEAELSTVSRDRLEADPAAGEARQREAVEAEIEIVLHASPG